MTTYYDNADGEGLSDAIIEELKRICRLTDPDEQRNEFAALCRAHLDLEPRIVAWWSSVQGSSAFTATDPDSCFDPRMIGPYRLLKLLGKGGFGEVFHAYSVTPPRREVAIKILSMEDRASPEEQRDILARFHQEYGVLAAMSHPAIASYLDCGTSPLGPYFAMEYVADALPITLYCDLRQMTLNERIRVLQLVCEGVQHAHSHNVLHRDLKPANILVTRVEERHRPKIIDFGLARNRSIGVQGPNSIVGQFMGTPEYTAPEQAAGKRAIGPGVDVYSLGVVLYELLTGTTPFAGQMRDEQGNPDLAKVSNVLSNQEPEPPSRRVSQLTKTLGKAEQGRAADSQRSVRSTKDNAAMRRLDTASWPRALAGELDWITLKALAKDPERRYLSVDQLRADLQRYLNHEPVEALPQSTTYRVKKFIRRNYAQCVAAAVVCLIAVASGIAITWFWLEAEQQATQARNQEQVATEALLASKRSLTQVVKEAVANATDCLSRDEQSDACAYLARALEYSPDSTAARVMAHTVLTSDGFGLLPSATTHLAGGGVSAMQFLPDERQLVLVADHGKTHEYITVNPSNGAFTSTQTLPGRLRSDSLTFGSSLASVVKSGAKFQVEVFESKSRTARYVSVPRAFETPPRLLARVDRLACYAGDCPDLYLCASESATVTHIAHKKPASNIVMSTSGTTCVATNNDGESLSIVVWNHLDAVWHRTTIELPAALLDASVSGDGSTIVTIDESRYCRCWRRDASAWREQSAFFVCDSPERVGHCLSYNGKFLAVWERWSDNVSVFSSESHCLVGELRLSPVTMRGPLEGGFVALLGNGSFQRVGEDLIVAAEIESHAALCPDAYLVRCALSVSGKTAAGLWAGRGTGYDSGLLVVWATATGEIAAASVLPEPNAVESLLVSDDGDVYLLRPNCCERLRADNCSIVSEGNVEGVLFCYDTIADRVVNASAARVDTRSGPMLDAAVSARIAHNGVHFFANPSRCLTLGEGAACLWSTLTGDLIALHSTGVAAVAPSTDRYYVTEWNAEQETYTLWVRDAMDGRGLSSIVIHEPVFGGSLTHLAPANDDSQCAVTFSGGDVVMVNYSPDGRVATTGDIADEAPSPSSASVTWIGRDRLRFDLFGGVVLAADVARNLLSVSVVPSDARSGDYDCALSREIAVVSLGGRRIGELKVPGAREVVPCVGADGFMFLGGPTTYVAVVGDGRLRGSFSKSALALHAQGDLACVDAGLRVAATCMDDGVCIFKISEAFSPSFAGQPSRATPEPVWCAGAMQGFIGIVADVPGKRSYQAWWYKDWERPEASGVKLFDGVEWFAVSADTRRVGIFTAGRSVHVLDLSAKSASELVIHHDVENVQGASFSPDGASLVLAGERVAQVLDVRGQVSGVKKELGAGNWGGFIDYSPDGRFVLVFSRGGEARLLEAATLTAHCSFGSAGEEVRVGGFAASGNLLAVGFESGKLRVLRCDEFAAVANADIESTPYCLSWCPVRQVCIIGSQSGAHLWDPANGALVRVWPERVYRAAWSQDGSLIAVVDHRGVVGVLDGASGRTLARKAAAGDDGNWVDFVGNGQGIVAARESGWLSWQLAPPSSVASSVLRNLLVGGSGRQLDEFGSPAPVGVTERSRLLLEASAELVRLGDAEWRSAYNWLLPIGARLR